MDGWVMHGWVIHGWVMHGWMMHGWMQTWGILKIKLKINFIEQNFVFSDKVQMSSTEPHFVLDRIKKNQHKRDL